MKNNIKAVRENRGLTQQECADLFNVKLRAWQTYEQGVSEPKFETLCKIADKFDVTTDYLLGRPDSEPPADPIDNLVKKMTVQEMEADLMHRWLGLSPKAREAFLQVLRDIVHEDDKRRQAKESAEDDTDYITVSTTLGEIEDRMKAEEDANFKDGA